MTAPGRWVGAAGGGAAGITCTDAVAVAAMPSLDVAVSVYVVLSEGVTRYSPLVWRSTPGAGEMLAESALLRYQRRTTEPPCWTALGTAEKAISGRRRGVGKDAGAGGGGGACCCGGGC